MCSFFLFFGKQLHASIKKVSTITTPIIRITYFHYFTSIILTLISEHKILRINLMCTSEFQIQAGQIHHCFAHNPHHHPQLRCS